MGTLIFLKFLTVLSVKFIILFMAAPLVETSFAFINTPKDIRSCFSGVYPSYVKNSGKINEKSERSPHLTSISDRSMTRELERPSSGPVSARDILGYRGEIGTGTKVSASSASRQEFIQKLKEADSGQIKSNQNLFENDIEKIIQQQIDNGNPVGVYLKIEPSTPMIISSYHPLNNNGKIDNSQFFPTVSWKFESLLHSKKENISSYRLKGFIDKIVIKNANGQLEAIQSKGVEIKLEPELEALFGKKISNEDLQKMEKANPEQKSAILKKYFTPEEWKKLENLSPDQAGRMKIYAQQKMKNIYIDLLTQKIKKEKDILKDTPIRYLAYADEIGSALEGVVAPWLEKASIAVSALYAVTAVSVESAKAYKNTPGPKSEKIGRTVQEFIDETVFQSVASIFAPIAAIKGVSRGTKFALKTAHFSPKVQKWGATAMAVLTMFPIGHAVDKGAEVGVRKFVHPLTGKLKDKVTQILKEQETAKSSKDRATPVPQGHGIENSKEQFK